MKSALNARSTLGCVATRASVTKHSAERARRVRFHWPLARSRALAAAIPTAGGRRQDHVLGVRRDSLDMQFMELYSLRR